jgi:uncharacterized protein YggE
VNAVRIVSLAAVVSAALALTGLGGSVWASGSTSATSSTRAITVTGSGAATAVPNRVSFSFGVTTQGKTASDALSANSAEMTRVIAAIKRAGVAAKDVQTSAVSLSPRYSGTGEDIVGYTAANVVAATIRGVSKAGTVIDAAVGAGANQVYGPSFTRSDAAVLYRRALQAAVANARAKARALATAGKVRLGAVRSIIESSVGPAPVAEKGGAVAAGTPVEPGTQTIQATVTVEFALR